MGAAVGCVIGACEQTPLRVIVCCACTGCRMTHACLQCVLRSRGNKTATPIGCAPDILPWPHGRQGAHAQAVSADVVSDCSLYPCSLSVRVTRPCATPPGNAILIAKRWLCGRFCPNPTDPAPPPSRHHGTHQHQKLHHLQRALRGPAGPLVGKLQRDRT